MKKNITEFINELRESDDARKRRWLVILTVPAMLVVLTIWLFMLRANFSTTQAQAEDDNSSTQFFALLGRGVALVTRQFGRGFVKLGGRVNANLWQTTQLGATTEPQDFVLDSLEPITPKQMHGN